MVEEESSPTRTQEVLDWLVRQGFTLCSERDVHTCSSLGTQQDMAINLTFANETALGQGIIQDHKVDPDLTLLSDHHALTFMLGDPREMIDNLTEAKYNWKDAIEEEFIASLDRKSTRLNSSHT